MSKDNDCHSRDKRRQDLVSRPSLSSSREDSVECEEKHAIVVETLWPSLRPQLRNLVSILIAVCLSDGDC